ncbi:hypothetical protein CRE_04045 [Caenorhabditis remanei]|uniref:Uncharacterized protein n=2 Tax=Caenorhabditis remanei TaxID=31234 RepID=E3MMY9_CAERE|nr:hypothetical protein CRE_04045 [Caenorhabditis remanei]
MLYVYKKLQEAQEKSDETTKPWKMCEICDTEYGEAADSVPRVLACGHTICHTCATKLATSEYLRCPFDRKCTNLSNCTLESLPKNFTVLHM